jgi:hypothetical protein
MPTSIFDSSALTKRQQDRVNSRNLYSNMFYGRPIINGSFVINTYHSGAQTLYRKGADGCEFISECGICNIPPRQVVESNIEPPSPDTPSPPTIIQVLEGDGELAIIFLAPISDGGSPITDYEYSIDGGAFISAETTSSPIVITGLINGQPYSIVIRAINANGAGANSNTVNGTPQIESDWVTRISAPDITTSGYGITTDIFRNVYVTGSFLSSTIVNSYSTLSTAGTSSIVIVSTFGTLNANSIDGFITKYNSLGHAEWATNIGGGVIEEGYGITVDMNSNTYITGYGNSSSTIINNFSTVSSGIILTSTFGLLIGSGAGDIYIAKYNSTGQVQWATNIGGASADNGFGITTDINGNVYVTGVFANSSFINSFSTISSGIILTSTFGRLITTGVNDAYIAKYNSSGQALWATHISGAVVTEQGRSITTDTNGSVYMTGLMGINVSINNFSTVSSGFIILSTAGILTITPGGGSDAFIVKYNADGKCIL